MLNPPAYAAGRAAMCKIVMDCLRTGCRLYFGDENVGLHSTDLLIGCAVLCGQSEGSPMTAGAIAKYTGFPRATVIRHVRNMEKSGILLMLKDGSRSPAWITSANDPHVIAETVKLFDRTVKLCTGLSNLDTKPIGGK